MTSPETLDVAETMIRETVTRSQFPFARLVRIARDFAGTEPEAVWDLAALEGEEMKPLIEARSGASLGEAEVAARLQVTAQSVRTQVAAGELITFENGRGGRFPVWQFGRRGVHPWVRPLLDAYGHSGWGLLDFLTVPREPLGGETYLTLLRTGDTEPVLAAARRANPR